MTPESQDTPAAADSDRALHPFVRDGRLVSLPARQARRRAVLAHLAEACFETGTAYDERSVNDRLRAWCDGSEVDHVTVRRYLVDAGILVRADGVYARDPAALPAEGAAERYVNAMGLS